MFGQNTQNADMNGLPADAKKVYQKAYDAALDLNGGDDNAAMDAGWAAVKKAFTKDKNGKWVSKKKK